MKTPFVLIAVSCCTLSTSLRADLANGGFETGTIDGWAFSLLGELYVDRECPDGSFESYVLYPYAPETVPSGGFVTVIEDSGAAPEGTDYVRLEGWDGSLVGGPSAGYYPSWAMEDGCTYSLAGRSSDPVLAKLEQTISLVAGQGIEFMAEYVSDSPYRTVPGSDDVWLEVNNIVVWHRDTTALGTSLGVRSTGWVTHSYVVPVSGDYTISFVSEHQGGFGHHLNLDSIQIIPEPSILTLFGVGSLGWLIVRRRRELVPSNQGVHP